MESISTYEPIKGDGPPPRRIVRIDAPFTLYAALSPSAKYEDGLLSGTFHVVNLRLPGGETLRITATSDKRTFVELNDNVICTVEHKTYREIDYSPEHELDVPEID